MSTSHPSAVPPSPRGRPSVFWPRPLPAHISLAPPHSRGAIVPGELQFLVQDANPVLSCCLLPLGLGIMEVLSLPNSFQTQPLWDSLHSLRVPGFGESWGTRAGVGGSLALQSTCPPLSRLWLLHRYRLETRIPVPAGSHTLLWEPEQASEPHFSPLTVLSECKGVLYCSLIHLIATLVSWGWMLRLFHAFCFSQFLAPHSLDVLSKFWLADKKKKW